MISKKYQFCCYGSSLWLLNYYFNLFFSKRLGKPPVEWQTGAVVFYVTPETGGVSLCGYYAFKGNSATSLLVP